MARHCTNPIFKACDQRMSSTWSTATLWVRRSAQSMITPPITSAVATVIGLNRYSWIRSANSTPSTTAGMNASSRLPVKRRAAGWLFSPNTTSRILRRNSHTTARMAAN
ncbi:hypothetical protein D3C79_890110 [compost metagenome]